MSHRNDSTETKKRDKNFPTDDLTIGKDKEKFESLQNDFEEPVDGVIDLSAIRKKRFHVNRDTGTPGILELDTSDLSIITRLEQLYPKLQQLSQDASVKRLLQKDENDENVLTKLSQALTKIDMEMRKLVDEIFDSNVSEVCAPSGSMFDPFNGEFRFEHIIDALSKLYENNINAEFKKMSEKMKKRTSKYTKGK